MLVLLKGRHEEYVNDKVHHYGDAFLYNLPESTIKKEILKDNLYRVCSENKSNNHTYFTGLFDHGIRCLYTVLSRPEGKLTGDRERYIEQYLFDEPVNIDLLVRYVLNIKTNDTPEIEHLIYRDPYAVLFYAVAIKRRVLKFEEYYTNNKRLIITEQATDLLKEYEQMFNIEIIDKDRYSNIFIDFNKQEASHE